MTNNKGYSIIVLLIVFLLIGLAYLFSFRGNKVAVENILGDTGLIDDSQSDNPYIQALDAAKKVKLMQMKPISEADHYLGNLDAPVKIIYYSDFECPFCPDYVENLKKIMHYDTNRQIVFAFRHFILNGHSLAYDAAMASECASEQGAFWEMYNKLYENNREHNLGSETYLKNAKDLDLNIEKFSACMESNKYAGKIQTSINEAKSYGVSGTPSTYINGKSYPGAYPYEDFVDQLGKEKKGLKTIIKEALEK